MRKWKYAISFAENTPVTAPLPLAGDLYENMKKAVKYGYDAVEFHTRENYEFDMEKIRRMREEKTGNICTLVTGRLFTEEKCSLLGNTEETEIKAVNGLRQYIQTAGQLKTDLVIGWIKGVVPPGADREKCMERLGEKMKYLCEEAEKQKVRLLVEVINHYETNILNTADETLAFFEKYQLDNCYVHLDTYHMGLEEFDPCDAIRRCGKRLGYLHVADNSRRYPGSGQFDFKKILSILEEIDYSGFVTVECLPEPDRDTAAKKAIAHLKACEP